MSTGAQAIFLFIAFACFVVSAILAGIPKLWYATLVAAGLACWVFVPFWIAVKA